MNEYDVFMALCMGVGLSAAAGFRVFMPPFLLSVLVRADTVEIDVKGTAFEYFDSDIAVFLLGSATLIELLAYYIPWVDNLLDSIATPAAVIAGTGMTSMLLEGSTDPVLQWSLAIIAGGGVSASIQGATVITRGASTMLTGGIGNPAVSTIENLASIIFALVAILLPFVAAFGAAFLVAVVVRKAINKGRNLAHSEGPPS